MGTIIMHAGMPKAGSSSVQRWVETHVELVRQHRVEPMKARVLDGADDVVLQRYERKGMSSGQFVRTYVRRDDPALVTSFCRLLDEAARGTSTVLVSCEAFGNLLTEADRPFLDGLESLASSHRVRVACYLRPQHTHFEAAWKQWGFRSGRLPSDFLGQVADRLDYLRTLRNVADLAPSVELVLRPFRRDLLDGGNIVVDFAGRFLGIDDLPPGSETWWANPGLPLDLANLLRDAPVGLFFTGAHNDPAYKRLKRAVDDWTVVDSEKAQRSRVVLQAYARAQFEPSNVELIRELGWRTDHFVPPIDEAASALLGDLEPKLDVLDELWEPDASPAERHYFIAALEAAVTDKRRRGVLERWLPRPWYRKVGRAERRTARKVKRSLKKVSRLRARRGSR
jgi:hypothetical protein